MIAPDKILERAGKFAALDLFSPALSDRRAVAVGAGNKNHILAADAVAQKARVGVGKNQHTADMAEMQLLIAVGHTARDDCALRKYRARDFKRLPVGIVLTHSDPPFRILIRS